jgi:Undecaprenyl-phosphate glucose phosphotransferase
MAAFTAEDMKRIAEPDPPPVEQDSPARHERLFTLAESLVGQSAQPAYSPIVLAGLVRITEFVIVLVCGLLARRFTHSPHMPPTAEYLAIGLATSVVAALSFQAVKANAVTAFRAPIRYGIRIACAWTLVILAAAVCQYFFDSSADFSGAWLASWYGLALASLLAERGALALITRQLTRAGRLDRRAVIVGGGDAGEQLLSALSMQPDTDLKILGVFDDRTDDRSPDVVGGYPKLGTVDDLIVFARHARIDLAIFTLPITAEQRLLQMLRKLWVLPIDIRLSAHANKLRLRPRSYSYIGSVPVLDVFDKPIADWDVVLKQIFDKLVGSVCLALASPLLLAVAIAVKLDSRGPILFRQKRYGFNNELIEVFKFRSMFVEASDQTASKLVTRGDPRVTRVGRFIRRTSLDELPQLLNVVFKGNLSLVGPRPHAVHAKAADRQYDEVVDGYFARHRVKPGITGWAQVNGWRGETDTPEKIQHRVEHDLAYIENWSLLFDLYILAITPFALVKDKNAY